VVGTYARCPEFVIPVARVDIDMIKPDEISRLIERGAKGIKFIGPMHSYGADVYSGREPRRGLGRQAVFRLGRQLLHPGQPPIHGLHRLL